MLAAGLLFFAVPDCGGGAPAEPVYDWGLPEAYPIPVVPDSNPMSADKVELGRRLFYDRRLSGNGTFSCASCHHPDKAFTDGLTTAIGSTGGVHLRNAMSLTNVAYNTTFNWANTAVDSLEVQSITPFFGESPIVELGLNDQEDRVAAMMRSDPDYRELVPAAFPDEQGDPGSEDDPFRFPNVIRAIAAFERTLISANSPYDRLQRGDRSGMSESAMRGMDLFFSEKLECFHCHGGLNLGQPPVHTGTVQREPEMHVNALYNIGGTGAYPEGNRGLWEITGIPSDMGRFKAPTLRNIELTAPYMHDGSIATLDEVLDHYARGGRLISSGPYAGDGALNPNKSIFIVGFTLTPAERVDVINFLKSLTDWEFICEERFQDPFGHLPVHGDCSG